MNKDKAINIGKIKTNAIEWYVLHCNPSLDQQRVLLKQIVHETSTELLYPERGVFLKELNTQNFWTFELGTQGVVNVHIWVFVVFQQSDRQHDQNLNNDTFYRLLVKSAQCIIGTGIYPDTAILLIYDDDDDCSQEYGLIKEVFKALTNDNIFQSYISEDDFRWSNDGDNIVYTIHSFDIQYQKNFESVHSVKVEFKLDGVVPAVIYGYALVLKNRLVSINSGGHRMFDLV